MNEEKVWELMVKMHHHTISTPEAEKLNDWIQQHAANRQLAESMSKILRNTDVVPETQKYNTEKAWIQVEKRIAPDLKTKYLTPLVFRWAAAAILTIGFIGIAYWQMNSAPRAVELTSVSTQARELKKIVLPDGTQVWMNAHSSISYPTDFDADSLRVVRFTGEAFFEVTHNPKKPFVVKSEDYHTRVLGTSFNVRLTENEASVMVLSGKVRFSYNEDGMPKSSVDIEKGYQAVANKNHQLVKSGLVNMNTLAWRTGILEFKNETIAHVIKDLSQHYHVSIQSQIDEPQEYLFTGTIEQVSVETALETICYSLHLRWKKTPHGYLIFNR